MAYDPIKGYSPDSIEFIEDFHRQQINAEFNTNYTIESFRGSGFWRSLRTSIERDREVELKIMDNVQQFLNQIQIVENLDIITNNYGLLYVKFLELVKDASFYHPQTFEEKGSFGICLQYNNESDKDDLNLNSQIANILANNIGTSNLTIDYSGSGLSNRVFNFNGINEVTGQVLPFNWIDEVQVEVQLRLDYRKKEGFAIPSLEEIKKTLLENLAAYRFGSLFTPQVYVDCDFSYFREKTLNWSINGSPFSNSEFQPLFYNKLIFKEENITIVNLEA